MVRSKEVPKKPKDPLLTPPSKPRGFSIRDDGGGFGGSMPRNRGGTAMSPAPASVPNYMRATNSSGAKAGQRERSASASPASQRRPVRVLTRGKVLFPTPAAAAAAAGMVRPTCSSTLKETKFPSALDLAPGATDAQGPAAMRVCPYTYCSLNGHTHSPAVPLRSFLATRRRLIKTQQSMKHRGVSAFRRGTPGHESPEDRNRGAVPCVSVEKAVPPLVDEDALGDFFVEVYSGPRVSSGTSCSDMSLDEMDATVRRMEFVVFDRCGADDDNNEKGNDLGVCDDDEGSPEERPGICRDSSSECSDAGISGNLVEELPWMRYQGYECDSLDDDVSEEQGVIREEIGEAEVLAQGQQDKDEEGTSGGLGDEREEDADEEQKPEGDETISDLSHEMGIIAEEEGFGCRVDTMHQPEASTGQETQHPGDVEDCVSDVVDKMEIAAEQACIVYTGDACKELEEKDEDKFEEKLSDSVCEPENPKFEVTQSVEDAIEDSCKEENSADQEAKDDEANMDSAGELEMAEKQKDGESEMEISETVPDVACKDNFFEQEEICITVLEGEVSDSSAIGSPDVEISNQPTDGGFDQDVNTVEDAFEQHGVTMNDSFEQPDATTSENTASGTEDAQNRLEVATWKSEDASEEYAITQEISQDFNSVCVDAPAKMEPENTDDKMENSSEESSIPQESSQSDKRDHVNNDAQIEAFVDAPAQTEPEITECKLEGSGIAQEIVHDNSVYIGEGAQMLLGNVTSELEETSEESCIPQEIVQDDNSAYISDDSQTCSEITTPKLDDASQSVTVDQDYYNCADVSGCTQNDSEDTPCELGNASEGSDVTQEAVRDDNTTPCELGNASEGSNVTQEAARDDNTVAVNDCPQKELETAACEPEHANEGLDVTQEGDGDDYAAVVYAGALKETQTCDTKYASEEVCITEEANLMSIVQTPQHNSDLSTTDTHLEPQNLPAEDTDAKEFSVDDMCNVFSGMNLKGDVYVDPTESEISPRKRLIIAGRRRTPEEEYMRGFNPRAPNFLPLELDPDSEKVDLRHQTAEDRKNAEEWMIDYALRRAVNNLGPARKKKVELLVQAFETVLPHEEDDKKNITPTRPAQACN